MTLETLFDINPAISINDVTVLTEHPNTFIITGFIDLDDTTWFCKRGIFHMKEKSFTYKKRSKKLSREKLQSCKRFTDIYYL